MSEDACMSGVRVISQSACKCRVSVRQCGVRVETVECVWEREVCVRGSGVICVL